MWLEMFLKFSSGWWFCSLLVPGEALDFEHGWSEFWYIHKVLQASYHVIFEETEDNGSAVKKNTSNKVGISNT